VQSGQYVTTARYKNSGTEATASRPCLTISEWRISRQPFPVKLMIDQIQLENVESFKYLGSMLKNDRSYICEIKSRIAMTKSAFNKKRALLPAKWTRN
jgi:hypothetical protein